MSDSNSTAAAQTQSQPVVASESVPASDTQQQQQLQAQPQLPPQQQEQQQQPLPSQQQQPPPSTFSTPYYAPPPLQQQPPQMQSQSQLPPTMSWQTASSSSLAPASAVTDTSTPAAGDDAASAAAAASSSAAASDSSNPQLLALRKLDALSESLQREGKLLEALTAMEKGLILRGHIFGIDSAEVSAACRAVAEVANYIAMTLLQQDAFDVALELLKKAEVLSERLPAVRAVTLNNLACYYRKRGKLRTALEYCRRALGIEAKLQQKVKSADTHLNMCTILSELKRHDKAITHANIALKLLLLELFGEFDQQQQRQQQQQQSSAPTTGGHDSVATTTADAASSSASIAADAAVKAQLRASLPPDRVAVLAIAYHNLAVQQEFLRRYDDALVSYDKARKVVQTHLGSTHPLSASLTESYKQAKAKMQMKQQRQRGGGASGNATRSPRRPDNHTRSTKGLQHSHSKAQTHDSAAASTTAAGGFSDSEYTVNERNHTNNSGFISDGGS